jgi:hypothetical protein
MASKKSLRFVGGASKSIRATTVQYQLVLASISPQVAFNTKVLVFGATAKFSLVASKEPLRSFAENTAALVFYVRYNNRSRATYGCKQAEPGAAASIGNTATSKIFTRSWCF